jgi:hypothetical protein
VVLAEPGAQISDHRQRGPFGSESMSRSQSRPASLRMYTIGASTMAELGSDGYGDDRSQRGDGPREWELSDGYWRAANYLSVGKTYLRDNPLGAHMPRVISARGLNGLYITGPGLRRTYGVSKLGAAF